MKFLKLFKQTKQQSTDEIKLDKTFAVKLDQFRAIYQEADNLIKPINNLYWCIDIGLDYTMPTVNEISKTMKAYYSLTEQLYNQFKDIENYYQANLNKLADYRAEYKLIKQNYNNMYNLIYSMIDRFETLYIETLKCKQFNVIIENLEKAEKQLAPLASKKVDNSNKTKNKVSDL